jgi:hypothetical protein
VGLWALLAVPARHLAGNVGVEGLSYAALLCVVPGLLTIALVFGATGPATPTSTRAMLAMAGMLLRMFVVLGGVLVIHAYRPDLKAREFFVWLVVFYAATLAAETYLVLRPAPSA